MLRTRNAKAEDRGRRPGFGENRQHLAMLDPDLFPDTGHLGAGHAIGIAFPKRRDAAQGRRRRGRRGDEDRRQAGAFARQGERLGFEDRYIGDEQAVGARFGGGARGSGAIKSKQSSADPSPPVPQVSANR